MSISTLCISIHLSSNVAGLFQLSSRVMATSQLDPPRPQLHPSASPHFQPCWCGPPTLTTVRTRCFRGLEKGSLNGLSCLHDMTSESGQPHCNHCRPRASRGAVSLALGALQVATPSGKNNNTWRPLKRLPATQGMTGIQAVCCREAMSSCKPAKKSCRLRLGNH